MNTDWACNGFSIINLLSGNTFACLICSRRGKGCPILNVREVSLRGRMLITKNSIYSWGFIKYYLRFLHTKDISMISDFRCLNLQVFINNAFGSRKNMSLYKLF